MSVKLAAVGNITWLHPVLLAGLAAAILPILIHLIGRRRAPTVHFAAFDFLAAVNKRLARRERLRQILLLLLRTLAIAALVGAVARPLPPRPVAHSDSERRLVLVIDTSRSMNYRVDGRTLLEHAKEQALEALSHLQPGDAVTVILAGAELSVPFQTPTFDHAAARTVIDAIGAADTGTADMAEAIDTGLAQLGNEGSGATLLMIGDLSKNSFEGLRPTALEPPPEVRLVDAANRSEAVPLGNVAIESVHVEPSREVASERRFRVTLHNYGATAVSGRGVALRIADTVVLRGYTDIPAHGSAEKILTHTFDSPGVYSGRVELAKDSTDGYAYDDVGYWVTDVAAGVRVLAVNGDPRTTPYEDELFFAERALEAAPNGEPPINLRIVTVDELPDTQLEGFDVVLLAHVSDLPDNELTRLREFLAAGGGLFISLGSRISFETANNRFKDLLPFPLRDLHRAADMDAGTPPVGIDGLDWDHPILRGLGAEAEESLRSSRTASYYNVGVGAGLRVRPVLRFSNGAPALLERRSRQGHVMLLTTSIDVDMSDLALRSIFPPLLQRTMRYLANSLADVALPPVHEGTEVKIAPPTQALAVALIDPKNERREVAFEGNRPAVVSRIAGVGIHRAEVLREDWQPELA
ncbi:MAG: VWA domain-containing protein [Myxococcota bacterium]